jgi:hypothetical protein
MKKKNPQKYPKFFFKIQKNLKVQIIKNTKFLKQYKKLEEILINPRKIEKSQQKKRK